MLHWIDELLAKYLGPFLVRGGMDHT